jgi:branched-chain amino acid transport system permease protein
MNFWLVLAVNSVTFGGLLFLLSAGFSLIFGLMRIPNLTHGSLFMVGAYIGATFVLGLLGFHLNFWLAALLATLTVAALGALAERLLLRRMPGEGFARFGVIVFPAYRLAIIVIAIVFAIGLWLLLDRTRLGAMIRAGVDDPDMARVVGIRVSQLFTIVFALGAGLAAFAGIVGGPILSVYPGLDQDMLPLALVVVILGGTGSLLGSFIGSIIVGFIYNFGQALLPELAYFVLFLPMLLVLLLRPQGLFGRHVP